MYKSYKTNYCYSKIYAVSTPEIQNDECESLFNIAASLFSYQEAFKFIFWLIFHRLVHLKFEFEALLRRQLHIFEGYSIYRNLFVLQETEIKAIRVIFFDSFRVTHVIFGIQQLKILIFSDSREMTE